MAGREHERDPGYDDWFDEPDPPPERRRRGRTRAPESGYEDDDWAVTDTHERAYRREPFVIAGRTLTTTQVAILAISALAIVLAILAATGVFSGGSNPAAPPTVPKTVPKVTPANTTPATTPTAPAAQAPTATLKPADTGAQVTLLQKALAALGYSAGKADGNYGDSTKTAVASFQSAKGLTADGVFGTQTLAALTSALSGKSGGQTSTPASPPTTTLKPGDTGSQVTLLQQALIALGYSAGTADGNYGPSTKTAVTAFQQAHNLTADGVLGPQTLAALTTALNQIG